MLEFPKTNRRRKLKPFTEKAKAKGWKNKELAERWGVSPRQISNVSAAPKQKDWDALAGVPYKKIPIQTTESRIEELESALKGIASHIETVSPSGFALSSVWHMAKKPFSRDSAGDGVPS